MQQLRNPDGRLVRATFSNVGGSAQTAETLIELGYTGYNAGGGAEGVGNQKGNEWDSGGVFHVIPHLVSHLVSDLVFHINLQ